MTERAERAKAVCQTLLEYAEPDEVCNVLLCALGTMIVTRSEHKAAQILRMRVLADQLQVEILLRE